MYKNRLQELCQKKKWELPKYTATKNGPPHTPVFTATVTVQNQMFETSDEFKSSKDAHNAAAKIAYDHFDAPLPATVYYQSQAEISPPPEDFFPASPLPSSLPTPSLGLLMKRNNADSKSATEEGLKENSAETIGSHDKSPEGLYKNLLQEFAQKGGLLCPTYVTTSSGMSHMPKFVSNVAIASDTFRGEEANTKKQSEMNAAKVAYLALTKGPDIPSERVEASLETLEKQPLLHWKTVVIPWEVHMPLPEYATKKLYSNEQWVAFQVGVDIEIAV